MNFEDLQKTWQSQQNSFELTIDSDLVFPLTYLLSSFRFPVSLPRLISMLVSTSGLISPHVT